MRDRDTWVVARARRYASHPLLAQFSRPQRLVIASIAWERRTRPSHRNRVLGTDDAGRPVVEAFDILDARRYRTWAILRNGEPVDVTGVVRSLRDGATVTGGLPA